MRLAHVIENGSKPSLPQTQSVEQLAAMRARYPNAPDHWLMMLAEGGGHPPPRQGASTLAFSSRPQNVQNGLPLSADEKISPVNKSAPTHAGAFSYKDLAASEEARKSKVGARAPLPNLRPKFVEDDTNARSGERGAKVPPVAAANAAERPRLNIFPDITPDANAPVLTAASPRYSQPLPQIGVLKTREGGSLEVDAGLSIDQEVAAEVPALVLPAVEESPSHQTVFVAPIRDEGTLSANGAAFVLGNAPREDMGAPQANIIGDEDLLMESMGASAFLGNRAEEACAASAPGDSVQQPNWPELPPLPPEFEQFLLSARDNAAIVDAYFAHAIERGRAWNALPF